MTRRSSFVAMTLGLSGLAAAFVLEPRPLLIWNATTSAPVGLWRVDPARLPVVGQWAVVRPDAATARWLSERGYLPLGAPLLKRVAAGPGQTVCRRGAMVRIDGQRAARARAADSRGRPLPVWSGCWALGVEEVFLLNPHADSLDGRYLGPTSARQVLGRGVLVWAGRTQ
jgi:type IV secretory pathway protease TraF